MKYAAYVLGHLRHSWMRTLSTVLAMSVCIFLFCTLQSVLAALQYGLDAAQANRLVTRHAVSLVFPLPRPYVAQTSRVQGVRRVAVANWFSGVYRGERKNFFANFAVEAEPYFAMYPEFVVPEAQFRDFLRDRRGAAVGIGLVRRFGWKIGDVIQLTSDIPPYQKGSPFEFVIRAIYDTDPVRWPGTDLNTFYFHFDYLWEGTNGRCGVGVICVQVNDPGAAGVIAQRIDALFENSDAQTKTETEAAFMAGMIAMAGNLTLLLNAIGLAVTFTILLVTANTMGMAVRERRTEIAVLKTLGFPGHVVMGLFLGEAALLGAAGGALGILLASAVLSVLPYVPMLGQVLLMFPGFGLSARTAALGFGFAVLLGLLAGAVPAALAFRARITDALRAV